MNFPSYPSESGIMSDCSELFPERTNLFDSDVEPFTVISMKKQIIFEERYKLFDVPLAEENRSKNYSGSPIFKRIGRFYSERRKENKDLIRKKIKSKFYKEIKTQLNKKFKQFKIKEKFEWPQNLVTNVEKAKNKKDLNTSLENLFLENDILVYEKNKKTLKDTELKCIFEANMKDLYSEYIKSKQYQGAIDKLIGEQNSYEYIHNYIQISKDFVEYYEKTKINSKKN